MSIWHQVLLNPPNHWDSGAMQWWVDFDEEDPSRFDGGVKIKDCNRSVTLSFYSEGAREIAHRRRKVEKMMEELNKFYEHLLYAELVMQSKQRMKKS